ncbi:hypothetical protein ORI20_32535 [Mycobacterium sp. CVI_P3]|uniref:Uncharacterized protein n=1 Tax=Mycobacterium pinniadriaticum TaxID=2994102 RepID=A0ABT3SQD0_9MYCO|nr:hypothetical protein [Mycobacterium pinniadriaticum]MCX2934991.1 hypothetical protein [Mycobacterium pinniadriaticum]MCX2941413.1 hypothetical protein [Mycobacterium pinniadriaticum]
MKDAPGCAVELGSSWCGSTHDGTQKPSVFSPHRPARTSSGLALPTAEGWLARAWLAVDPQRIAMRATRGFRPTSGSKR